MKFHKVKQIHLIVILIIISLNSIAQTSQVKNMRQTYLWDVTLSMKGKVTGCPNIWETVKKAMIFDIQQVDDESTELVVIPFQHKALEEWREMATPEGKERLVSKIKEYEIPLFDFNGRKTTKTNLYAPLQYAVDNVLTKDKVDVLKLMTDGENEMQDAEYENLLNHWCAIAKEKDAYGFYIMLNDAAKAGRAKMGHVNTCRFESVDVSEMAGSTVSILALAPQQSLAFNARDNYGNNLSVKYLKSGTGVLPKGYMVHIYCSDNPFVEIDDVVEVCPDYTATVKVKYLMSQQEMFTSLPIECNEQFFIFTESALGMDIMPFATTQIIENQTVCEMINKPEKTVRFYADNFGKTNYFKDFLWKKYVSDTLKNEISFEFNDDAKAFMKDSLQLALFKKAENGTLIPVNEDEITLLVNGKKCQNNIITVFSNTKLLNVGLVFNPKAANKVHHWFFKVIQDGGLERINDLDAKTFRAEGSSLLEVETEKNRIMNPLAEVFMFIGLGLLALILLWFVALKSLIFPTFRVKTIMLNNPNHMCEKKIHNARKLILTKEKVKQSGISRFFSGTIVYDIHPVWTTDIVIEPRDKKSAKIETSPEYWVKAHVLKVNQDYMVKNNTTGVETTIKVI